MNRRPPDQSGAHTSAGAADGTPKKIAPPLKILFLSRACSLSAGGMERFSHDLIQMAAGSPDFSPRSIGHRGSRATAPIFLLTVIPRALIKSRRCDVVHLGDPSLSLAGWLIQLVWRKKIIVTVHGLDITYPHPLYQLYLRLFFRAFAYYFPISQAVATQLRRFNVSGQIKVINPPLTTDYFDPAADRRDLVGRLARLIPASAAKLAASDNVFFFTCGRLVPRKGQAWFIAHVLPHLPPGVHYLIAGSGPGEKTLPALIKAHRLNGRVHLLGRVSLTDLRLLYNTADAFIQPNIPTPGDIEGFGLVLLEAAACQLPVFASAIDGIPDAITAGQNGTLLPAGNAAAWLSALRPFLTHVSRSPQARAFTLHNFSWDNYRRSLVKALR